MNKKCIKCEKEHPEEGFNFKNKEKGKRANICKFCHRVYVKEHYANNKDIYKKRATAFTRISRLKNENNIIEYLNDHPCVDCNEKDIIVLEFDHIYGKKAGAIAQLMRGWCWKSLFKEIAKCEVRCANCHRRKTAKEFGYYRALYKN